MSSNTRLLWIALVSTAVWTAVMTFEATHYTRLDCPTEPFLTRVSCAGASPIAALELASDGRAFRDRLDQADRERNELWNIEVARANTWMDFLLIGLYTSTFWLLARQAGARWRWLVGIAISVAATADLIENLRLLRTLQALPSQPDLADLPRVASIVKWSGLAIAEALMGAAMLTGVRPRSRTQGILLWLSAAFTASGIFFLPLLLPGNFVLLLVLVLAIWRYFPLGRLDGKTAAALIECAYLLRFQLFAAFLLAIVLPSAYIAAASIFVGLFDALGFWSFVFIVWASLQIAWTVMITIRLVLVYGPDRFSGVAPLQAQESVSAGILAVFGALAAPTVVMACCGTHLPWYEKLAGIALGTVLAVGVLWLTAALHFYIEPDPGHTARAVFPGFALLHRIQKGSNNRRSAAGKQLDRMIGWVVPEGLQAGLLRNGRLRSGHQLAGTILALLLVLYAVLGVFYAPELRLSHRPPAALFYGLFLITLLTWVFSGLAYFLDMLRLPVLTTAVFLSLFSGIVQTDHLFTLKAIAPRAAPSATEALVAWERTGGSTDLQKPLLVVATEGGGIRAAAWTATVLTGLSERCASFSSSLLLVSSVSGGSVGSMYFLGAYDPGGGLRSEFMTPVRDDAAQSSLTAVGWGLLYPDLVRTLPIVGPTLNSAFGQYVDRGWALEQEWMAHWDHHLWTTPPTLRGWSDDVSRGARPAAIFNATAAESGQRFLLGSTVIAREKTEQGDDPFTIQFATAFSGYDLPVSTAVRLSATFPWVSPMPRAAEGEARFRVHLADGGYYDNSGVLSATQWILEARDAIKSHPVVFILIDSTERTPRPGASWSWQRQVAAPVEALLAVRTSSQQLRGRYELDAIRDYLKAKGLDVTVVHLTYPADRLAPLSWHLTKEQWRRIQDAWTVPDPTLRQETQKVIGKLGCSTG